MINNSIRRFEFENTDLNLAIGDIVWYYFDGVVEHTPAPAMVVEFGEDNMVTLEVHAMLQPGRHRITSGVCLHGDPRLENMNFRKRGVWAPRGSWAFNNGPPRTA